MESPNVTHFSTYLVSLIFIETANSSNPLSFHLGMGIALFVFETE